MFLGIFSILFITVFDINVSDNVVAKVVHNDHVLYFTILHHLFEDLFVKVLVFHNCSLGVISTHYVAVDKGNLDWVVFVHVFQTDSLTNGGFIMDSLAAVTITASSHLIEKGTVHFVHFCSIDFRQSFSHQPVLKIIRDTLKIL